MNKDHSQYLKKNCRYCESTLPAAFLELGAMALANSFVPIEEKDQEEFCCPLSICRCNHCGLVQLTHVVPADMMFKHYLYVSSTTKTFREHFAKYARDCASRLTDGDSIPVAVDIGSNDGLLVKNFSLLGMRGVGVEPADNLAQQANKEGIFTINDYFNADVVDQILARFGKADIITANNVFAHIDNIHSVCRNVYRLLSSRGFLVIEFPYMAVMLEDMVFDMIYHEHLSYINIHPLKFLMNKFDMDIFDVEKVDSHGGSLRVFIQKKNGVYKISKNVNQFLNYEKKSGYTQESAYTDFAGKVRNIKKRLRKFVNDIKLNGQKIAGYGAPAKGNTIINFCEFKPDQIDFIVDDNPMKQDMLSPGANIPVVSSRYLKDNLCDYVIVFAWNFAKEIIANNQHIKDRGVKFIIPLPEPTII